MGNAVTDFFGGLFKDGKGNVDPTKVAGGLAALTGLYGATNRDSSVGEFMFGRPQQPVGYMGGIPEYNVARSLAPNAFATTTPTGEPRRPGSGGRRYFTDTTYTPTGKIMAGATPSQGVYNALTATQANKLFSSLFGTGGLGGEDTEGLGVLDMAMRDTPEQAAAKAAAQLDLNKAIAGAKAKADADAAAAAAKTKADADAAAAAAPYNAFIKPYLGGKTLTDNDLLTLRSSGYDVGKLATDLKIKELAGVTGVNQLISGTQGAEARAAATVADQIRQGKYTPATAATEINKLYPGYKATEESLVFELLNRGQTTPQEVAKYYAARGYAPEEVLARYQQLGGTRAFAQGGLASLPQSRGYYLGGATDGMADEIPATIENTEPAALSDGEFVIPADVVSHLGNGNSDAGAKQLYAMMDRIRQARTGRKEQGRNINPNKYLPT
jgi:hypothetical protein